MPVVRAYKVLVRFSTLLALSLGALGVLPAWGLEAPVLFPAGDDSSSLSQPARSLRMRPIDWGQHAKLKSAAGAKPALVYRETHSAALGGHRIGATHRTDEGEFLPKNDMTGHGARVKVKQTGFEMPKLGREI